jgi:hypothetical protein
VDLNFQFGNWKFGILEVRTVSPAKREFHRISATP